MAFGGREKKGKWGEVTFSSQTLQHYISSSSSSGQDGLAKGAVWGGRDQGYEASEGCFGPSGDGGDGDYDGDDDHDHDLDPTQPLFAESDEPWESDLQPTAMLIPAKLSKTQSQQKSRN